MATRASPARPERALARLGCALAASLALAGCVLVRAQQAPQEDAAPGALAAPPAFPLLSPASFGGTARLEQVLHAAYGETEMSLVCHVSVDPAQLTVLGTTALGQRVFSLSYDGRTLKSERSSFAPKELQPERIVADLQLAFWPAAALKAALAGSGWSLTEPRPGLRRLARDGRIWSETHAAGAEAPPGRLWLVNLAYGYSIDIQTRPYAAEDAP